MWVKCAVVFFYQQPWQLDSSNVSAGVGWMTLFPSTIAVVAGSLPFGVNPPLLRCCRYRFRSYSGSLLADARMAGPAKSKQKVFAPAIRPDFVGFPRSIIAPGARPDAAHRRRAIPGPSRLSRHPCRSTPYTTIPLGLLTGRLASLARLVLQNLGAKALRQGRSALALLFGFAYTDSSGDSVSESRQEAEWRCCGEGRLAWMPNEE